MAKIKNFQVKYQRKMAKIKNFQVRMPYGKNKKFPGLNANGAKVKHF